MLLIKCNVYSYIEKFNIFFLRKEKQQPQQQTNRCKALYYMLHCMKKQRYSATNKLVDLNASVVYQKINIFFIKVGQHFYLPKCLPI